MLELIRQERGHIGRYEIVRRLGLGGMAEVLLARVRAEAGFVRPVAIKRLLPHWSKDLDVVEMFIDEARICASLHHSNIVQVSEFGRCQGQHYIAMEYVHGCSLTRAMAVALEHGQRIPSEVSAFIMANICSALDYAHALCGPDGKALGIVHRDVKPSNILLGSEGQVKLIDFGVAWASSRCHKTREHTIKGSLAYMSPEQARAAAVDHRSDIYSAGTVLYILLAGKHPLADGCNPSELLQQLQRGHVRPFPSDSLVPSELRQLCLRALQRDPDKRFSAAGEMAGALEAFCYASGFGTRQLREWLTNTLGGFDSIAERSTPAGGVEPRRAPAARRPAVLALRFGQPAAAHTDIWEETPTTSSDELTLAGEQHNQAAPLEGAKSAVGAIHERATVLLLPQRRGSGDVPPDATPAARIGDVGAGGHGRLAVAGSTIVDAAACRAVGDGESPVGLAQRKGLSAWRAQRISPRIVLFAGSLLCCAVAMLAGALIWHARRGKVRQGMGPVERVMPRQPGGSRTPMQAASPAPASDADLATRAAQATGPDVSSHPESGSKERLAPASPLSASGPLDEATAGQGPASVDRPTATTKPSPQRRDSLKAPRGRRAARSSPPGNRQPSSGQLGNRGVTW